MGDNQTALQLSDLNAGLLTKAMADPDSLTGEDRAKLREAGRLVGEFGDDLSPEGKRVRAQVAGDPTAIMQVLTLPSELTLITSTGVGKALDGLVSALGPDEAREQVDSHLTPDLQIEGILARDDLPSSFREVGDPQVLLAAILKDVTGGAATSDDEDDVYSIEHHLLNQAILARRWVYHIQEREDFDEVIDQRVGTLFTLRELALLGVWALAGRPYIDPDADAFEIDVDELGMTRDSFDVLGFDPDDAISKLQEFLADPSMDLSLDPEEQAAFLKRLDARRKAAQEASSVETEAAEAAEEAQDALDF